MGWIYMFRSISSFVLVLSLMANVVLGCTHATAAPTLVDSVVVGNQSLTKSVMSGCDDMTMRKANEPAKQHQSGPSFCKVFCATILLLHDRPHFVLADYVTPNEHLLMLATSWDSSVDPPYPRSSKVMI
jgi:hypothetical protein